MFSSLFFFFFLAGEGGGLSKCIFLEASESKIKKKKNIFCVYVCVGGGGG